MKHFFVVAIMLLCCCVACQPKHSPDANNATSANQASAVQSDTLSQFPFLVGKTDIPLKAPDSLTIHTQLYHVSPNKPIIVLCHQAGSSKDEYAEIAPKLNKLGYNCIALDQRSGGNRLKGSNATATEAEQRELPTEYSNAEPDMLTVIAFASGLYHRPVILWGSSYSASLALKIGKSNADVGAVVAFSPGEYFSNQSDTYILKQMNGFDKPLFITSAKSEAPVCKPFFDAATSTQKVQFIPGAAGIHGSRALWQSTPNHEEYWQQITDFLRKLSR